MRFPGLKNLRSTLETILANSKREITLEQIMPVLQKNQVSQFPLMSGSGQRESHLLHVWFTGVQDLVRLTARGQKRETPQNVHGQWHQESQVVALGPLVAHVASVSCKWEVPAFTTLVQVELADFELMSKADWKECGFQMGVRMFVQKIVAPSPKWTSPTELLSDCSWKHFMFAQVSRGRVNYMSFAQCVDLNGVKNMQDLFRVNARHT